MLALVTAFELVRDFMERGGPVLFVIFIAILALWAMVLERLIYFRTSHNRQVNEVMGAWEGRAERTSWHAHKIREAMISQINMDLRGSLSHIKTLVSVIPLMGLLGRLGNNFIFVDVASGVDCGNQKLVFCNSFIFILRSALALSIVVVEVVVLIPKSRTFMN